MKSTGIEWTDKTWNPWRGCVKVSPGCKFCYMYRDQERYGLDPKAVLKSKTFKDPLKWKEPAKVFTCSWSDFFIEQADQWRNEAWAIIKATPHLTYQILTKRPERIDQCLPDDWGSGYPNVWLGVSIETHAELTRAYILAESKPATVKFISAEPLLNDFSNDFIHLLKGTCKGFQGYPFEWIIIGGESGNDTGKYGYRPTRLEWIENLIDVSRAFGVHVFVKQLGTHLAKEMKLSRHGKKMEEWPSNIQLREFPNHKHPF